MSDKIQEWIDARPPHVRDVANRYRPDTCFKSVNAQGAQGHYKIHSYEENEDGTVTVKVDHLADSFMPGFRVFGFDPEKLQPCGCLMKH